MKSTTRIPESLAVNDAIRLYPATIAVFNDFGIDSCCGGAEPIAEAARRDGAELAALLAALNAVLEETP
jgi:regulator of cell morphogenesis and NO signaling